MDLTIFEKHVKIVQRTASHIKGHCPFTSKHSGGDDSTPSFTINIATGRWKCFGCGTSGGLPEFIRHFSHSIIPGSEVDAHHKAMLESGPVQTYMTQHKLLSLRTIKHFQLGFEKTAGWIWIPISNKAGQWVNVRKFDWTRSKRVKYTHYAPGFSHNFCWPHLKKNSKQLVVLCEGEFKALVLRKLGYAAQSVPSGAQSFQSWMLPDYKGREVVVLLDNDKAGVRAARRMAGMLEFYAKKVSIAEIPVVEGIPGGKSRTDIIDYLLYKEAVTCEQQREVVAYILGSAKKFDSSSDYLDVPLADATDADYTGTQIHTKVRVVGKDLAPYTLPRIVELLCTPNLDDGRSRCQDCPLKDSKGQHKLVIDHNKPKVLLGLAGSTDAQMYKTIRAISGAPSKCTGVTMKVVEYQNLEELTITPSMRSRDTFTGHVMRNCYFIGAGIKTNLEYGFYGVATAHPKSQYATQLVTRADPAQSDLDSWTNTCHEELKVFQKFDYDQYATDMEANIVKDLRGVRDMIEAMDYVFYSALTFDFNGARIRKGYCEAAIVGDPRLGKSTLAEALSEHYNAGELMSGEQTTLAGLLGSLQQVNNRWVLVWGKLPQLDRRLGLIDETSGISTDTISLLSGVRSSGMAELVKVRSEKTLARARLLWLSNCRRSGAQLKDYTFGIEAVSELFGAAEDIARLDFAFTVSSDDITDDTIYSERPVVAHKYTSELCSQLLMWVWTRKAEHIMFTPKAVKRCMALARAMGEKYSATIPLVKSAEQRNVLAKLAVAAAGRRYHTPDGERLIVTQAHVEMANDFLERCWCRTSMGYDVYSMSQKRLVINEKDVSDKILSLMNPAFFVSWALGSQLIRAADLAVFDLDKTEANDLIGFLAEQGCLKRGTYAAYVRTSRFITLLKKLSKNKKFQTAAKAVHNIN